MLTSSCAMAEYSLSASTFQWVGLVMRSNVGEQIKSPNKESSNS